MEAESLGVLRGTVDLLVLRALAGGPRHGYAVAKWVHSASASAIEIEDGALYQALHRMEGRGWISSEWGMSESRRRAKYYALTAAGRGRLETETRTWLRYSEAMARVLRGGD